MLARGTCVSLVTWIPDRKHAMILVVRLHLAVEVLRGLNFLMHVKVTFNCIPIWKDVSKKCQKISNIWRCSGHLLSTWMSKLGSMVSQWFITYI